MIPPTELRTTSSMSPNEPDSDCQISMAAENPAADSAPTTNPRRRTSRVASHPRGTNIATFPKTFSRPSSRLMLLSSLTIESPRRQLNPPPSAKTATARDGKSRQNARCEERPGNNLGSRRPDPRHVDDEREANEAADQCRDGADWRIAPDVISEHVGQSRSVARSRSADTHGHRHEGESRQPDWRR